jgi:large subunit ribosomal protein L17
LLRNLTTSLFRHERVRTTLPKAKELRPFVERLITLARRDDLHARRQVAAQVSDKAVVKKLFTTLGPRFATRPGGYTRILRLAPRQGDGADMAIIELIGSEPVFSKQKDEKKARKDRRTAAAKSTDEQAVEEQGSASPGDEAEDSGGEAARKTVKGRRKKAADKD